MLKHHPNDSRVTIAEDGICQSLTSRMGTGGGNVPIVIIFQKSRRAANKDDYETWVESGITNTLNTFEGGICADDSCVRIRQLQSNDIL